MDELLTLNWSSSMRPTFLLYHRQRHISSQNSMWSMEGMCVWRVCASMLCNVQIPIHLSSVWFMFIHIRSPAYKRFHSNSMSGYVTWFYDGSQQEIGGWPMNSYKWTCGDGTDDQLQLWRVWTASNSNCDLKEMIFNRVRLKQYSKTGIEKKFRIRNVYK